MTTHTEACAVWSVDRCDCQTFTQADLDALVERCVRAALDATEGSYEKEFVEDAIREAAALPPETKK